MKLHWIIALLLVVPTTTAAGTSTFFTRQIDDGIAVFLQEDVFVDDARHRYRIWIPAVEDNVTLRLEVQVLRPSQYALQEAGTPITEDKTWTLWEVDLVSLDERALNRTVVVSTSYNAPSTAVYRAYGNQELTILAVPLVTFIPVPDHDAELQVMDASSKELFFSTPEAVPVFVSGNETISLSFSQLREEDGFDVVRGLAWLAPGLIIGGLAGHRIWRK